MQVPAMPPHDEVGGGPEDRQHHTDTTDNHHETGGTRDSSGWTVRRGLQARRVASWRLPPLQCGCRDPLFDWTCTEEPVSLSEGDLSAWASAAGFLLRYGTPPILPADVLPQLWWRGVSDRLVMAWLRAEMAKVA